MKIVDANVLLYAVNPSAPHHERSRSWLEGALSGRETVGLPWVVTLAFARLSTRAGVFPRPLPIEVAADLVASWLEHPRCVVPEPTARHWRILSTLLTEAGTAGNLVTDAHVATLALEHRAGIVTWDRDFHRFPGVRVHVP